MAEEYKSIAPPSNDTSARPGLPHLKLTPPSRLLICTLSSLKLADSNLDGTGYALMAAFCRITLLSNGDGFKSFTQ